MKKRRKKGDPLLALKIARAQVRAFQQALRRPTQDTSMVPAEFSLKAALAALPISGSAPPSFMQCWAVSRGYYSITQALDTSGQVWERVLEMGKGIEAGKKIKVVLDSYWVRVPMTRKEEGE